MYWLIGKVNPFIDRLNNNTNSQDFLKEFESLDATTYYHTNAQQPVDNNSDSNFTLTYYDNSSLNDSINSRPDGKKQITSRTKTVIDDSIKNKKGNHSVAYVRIIKILEIIGLVFIVLTVGINIVESDEFFRLNKPIRIVGILLLNYIQDIPNNNSWNGLIKSDLNISKLLFAKNNEIPLEVIMVNYANNFNKTGIGYYSNITNEDIVIAYNISPDIYNYKENSSYPDYNFIIPFKSNKHINEYRSVILFISLILVVFSFFCNFLNYLLHKQNGLTTSSFYRTRFFFLFIGDLVLFFITPYPNLLTYVLFEYSSKILCFPFSVYCSIMVNFRLFYLIKLLKFSSWNSDTVKEKCAKYQVKHSLLFVFNCFELAHPFFLIFCIVCCFSVIFGLNIRLSEIYFADTVVFHFQSWEYYWNSLWFIITTMMSLGYGDFYPKTHIGRFLNFFVCISGIYVVTILMVNISKLSVLNRNEEKVYTLIKRLNYKSKIKQEYSHLIYYSIQSIISKRKTNDKDNNNDNNQSYVNMNRKNFKPHDDYYYNRKIHKCLIKKIGLQREMKKFDFVPNREMIMDLIEKLEADIKEINNEVIILQKINISVTEFLDSLKKIMINMKHSVISTKQMFNLIDKSTHAFGKLRNYDRRVLIEEFGANYASNKSLRKCFENQKSEDSITITERRRTNPNQFENFIIKQDTEEEINNTDSNIINSSIENTYKNTNQVLGNYEVTNEEFCNHFQTLFFESSFYQNKKKSFMKYNSCKRSHHKKLYTDQIFKKVKTDVENLRDIKKSSKRLNEL